MYFTDEYRYFTVNKKAGFPAFLFTDKIAFD